MTDSTPRATTTPVETHSTGSCFAVHVDTRQVPPVVRLATGDTPHAAYARADGVDAGASRVVSLPPSGVAQLLDALREADPDLAVAATDERPPAHQCVTDAAVVEGEISELDDPLTPEQDARASCLHQAAAVLERLIAATAAAGARSVEVAPSEVVALARYVETGATELTGADR